MTKKIYLLLKATVTKQITVPQYTRSDGTIVPAHQKTVNYDPDKSMHDVISGNGTSSQKQAHKKLSSNQEKWNQLSDEDKHAHILSSATNIQVRKTHHANVTRFKQSMLAGKVPSPGQYNAFMELKSVQRMKMIGEIANQIGGDKYKELIEKAEETAKGKDAGKSVAKPHHTEKKNQKALPEVFKKRSQMSEAEIIADAEKWTPELAKMGAKFIGEEFGNETSSDIPVGDDRLRVFYDKDTSHGELVQILKKAKAEAEKHIQDGTFKQWKHDQYFAKTGLSDDLIKYNYPEEISGVQWDYPMTEEQADGGNVNPKYKIGGKGYSVNCQTCVIAYEMRLRGYDVTAKERLKKSAVQGNFEKANQYNHMEKLAYSVTRGWFDKSTKDGYPEKIGIKAIGFLNICKKLDEIIEAGKRYHFRFSWKGGHSGHIITVGRNDNGEIEFYDPQNGKHYSVDEYNKKYGGHIKCKGNFPPTVFRVDHLMLRKAYASSIFDKGK